MKYKRSVVPLILLILVWASLGQAIQSTNKIDSGILDPSVHVSLAKEAMSLNDTLSLALEISGLSGQEIYSTYFRIAFDPSVINIIDVVQGQVTDQWNQPVWNIINNEVRISHYGLTPFTDNGLMLNLLITSQGQEDSISELTFALAALNEGQPQAEFHDGRVYLGIPYPQISPVQDSLFIEGDNLNLTMQVQDPLDRDLTLSLANLPEQASFLDNGDGSANFNWQTDYYSAGSYSMTLIAENEDNLSSELDLNLFIANNPQAPQIDYPFEDLVWAEDQSLLAYSLLDYVSDGDLNQGDSLYVSLLAEEDISLTYENGQISFSALANWFGSKEINLIISDSYGYETNQNILVQVTNVNDEIQQEQSLPEIEIDEDYQEYSLNLNDYFFDVDNLLTYSISGNEHISCQIVDNILSLTPQEDWFGQENIVLRVEEDQVINLDGQIVNDQVSMNESLTLDLNIMVNPLNDGPVILNSFSEIQVLMNSSFILESISSYFADVDSELTYSFTGNHNISISYNDDSFEITPNPAWVGVQRVTVTASDEYNQSVSQVMLIRVQAGYQALEDFDHAGSLPLGWNASGGSWQAVNFFTDDYAMRVLNPRISRTQRLTSKSYDLSGIYELQLAFDQEYDLPFGVSAILQYSLNGFTYYNIESFTGSSTASYSVQLPQVANNADVRFRWQYTSSTLASNYWKIDNFQLTGIVGNYLPPAPVTNLNLINATSDNLSFQWTPIENNFFNQYEIAVMDGPDLTDQVFIWNGLNDGDLYIQETSSTSISNLNYNETYYFAIRSSDVSGNVSEWSEIIAATPTSKPNITFVTQEDYYFSTLNPVISLIVTDDVMVDATSLFYRFDADNNGIYDLEEDWQAISGYFNSSQLDIQLPLSVDNDGLNYKIEVKCYDSQNSLFAYSGSANEAGIEDDFTFNIDSQAPASIEDLTTTEVNSTSLSLEWTPYLADDFLSYEIYYSASPLITSEDYLFSSDSDPNLSINSTTSTTIAGLQENQRYWFAILVIDKAGNASELSNIATNVLPSQLPVFSDIQPAQIQPLPYLNSQEVNLSCKIIDAYGIDPSSVQYRIDANGNGLYDQDELWLDAFARESSLLRNRSGNMTPQGDYLLNVSVIANYLIDGTNLSFEFRAKDIDGFGYVYTGSNQIEGIEDDWILNIDSSYPQAISDLLLGLTTTSTVQIGWTPSGDDNFLGYRIYFSFQPGVNSESNYVSWDQYPQLGQVGSNLNIFDLVNLQANTQYYLRVAAVDIAGNMTFSDEITFTTSSDAKPRKPENLTLTWQEDSLILTWDPVIEDTNGNSIDDVIYDIFVSENPDFELDGSNYYDSTYDNQYIFENIGSVLPKIFFKIQAYCD